eukprot:356754-Chlamydomonas_euryale.AAC.9
MCTLPHHNHHTHTPPRCADTHLVDAEILADVDHPGAEPGGGARLGADVVGVEAVHRKVVLLDLVDAVLGRVVLVKRLQHLEELVHVAHELLARRPRHVLGDLAAGRGEDLARRHDGHDQLGGRAERLELAERVLVERVERGLRLGDDRLGGLEVARALVLERLHSLLQLRSGFLVLAAALDRLVHDGLLLPNRHNQVVCLRLFLLHDDLLLLERDLQVRHLRARLRNLVHAVLQPLLGRCQLLALLLQQRLVQRDELKVRLGRRVVVSPHRLKVPHRRLGHALVRVSHVHRNRLAHRVLHIGHVDEEALRDRHERLVGPAVEPVKDGAVDERGELARADAELVSHRREAQHDVE